MSLRGRPPPPRHIPGEARTRTLDEHTTQRAAQQPASQNLEQNSSSGFLLRGLQVSSPAGISSIFKHLRPPQTPRSCCACCAKFRCTSVRRRNLRAHAREEPPTEFSFQIGGFWRLHHWRPPTRQRQQSNILRLRPVNPNFSEFFRSFNQAAASGGLFIVAGCAGRQAIDRL